MKYLLIALILLCPISIVYAAYRVIELKFSVPEKLTEDQSKKLEELKVLIESITADMIEPSDSYGKVEEKVLKTHICKHDEGMPCSDDVPIAVAEFPVETVAPAPTSTPQDKKIP